MLKGGQMDAQTLREAMGNALSLARYQELLPTFEKAMVDAQITNINRAAMWCAQLGHECVGLSALEEYASGAAYEWRQDLGNTQAGDGVRYKGRGAIMVTGRANYRSLSTWAHGKGYVPSPTYFEDNPKALQSNEHAFIGAVWYWTVARPDINALSDARDLTTVTRRINGGLNGLADRQTRYNRALGLGNRLLSSGGQMKDWDSLEPDKYTLVGPHRYTSGRARPIDRIIIHHNAANNWSAEQVRDLWNNSREASAHYQVESNGTIAQLVNDRDTAWHAANADINARSIGIEHANISGPPRWQISDATVEAGAHLVAALCRGYKLGPPRWGVNVFPHSQFTSTSCPVQLDVGGEDHQTYMQRAAYWYDNPGGTNQGGFLMALSDAEQRELLDKIRDIHRELKQLYPSRSAYRTTDKPIDTLAGMVLNADARIHEDWVHARAAELGITPTEFAKKLGGQK